VRDGWGCRRNGSSGLDGGPLLFFAHRVPQDSGRFGLFGRRDLLLRIGPVLLAQRKTEVGKKIRRPFEHRPDDQPQTRHELSRLSPLAACRQHLLCFARPPIIFWSAVVRAVLTKTGLFSFFPKSADSHGQRTGMLGLSRSDHGVDSKAPRGNAFPAAGPRRGIAVPVTFLRHPNAWPSGRYSPLVNSRGLQVEMQTPSALMSPRMAHRPDTTSRSRRPPVRLGDTRSPMGCPLSTPPFQ
jgi:hypothetical protein